MNSTVSESTTNHRWVAIASLLAVMMLDAVVIVGVESFRTFLERFGADLPHVTSFMLHYHRLVCLVFAAVSLTSAALLLMRPKALVSHLGAAYIASLSVSVGALLWVGFVGYTIFLPITRLGQPVH